jgi:hypothetical protein
MNKSHVLGVYCAFALACLASPANAATTTYSSQASFLSALGVAPTITHNYDTQAAGSTIAADDTLDGATYNYSLSGNPTPSILIDNIFDTTSGSNYLGTTDGSGAFVGGDAFTITFDQTMHAIGLYVISADLIFADDFTITTSSGQTANNIATSDVTLSDGDAYFIGLIEDDFSLGFNSITLSSFEAEYLFNVDDITVAPVPLPAAVWLFGSGLLGLVGISRRSVRKA